MTNSRREKYFFKISMITPPDRIQAISKSEKQRRDKIEQFLLPLTIVKHFEFGEINDFGEETVVKLSSNECLSINEMY